MHKKLLSFLLAALLTVGAVPAASMASMVIVGGGDEAETALAGGNTVNEFNGVIQYAEAKSTSVDGSVVGDIIYSNYVSGISAWLNVTPLFDGVLNNPINFGNNTSTTINNWIGIKTDTPIVPSSFRLATMTGDTPRSKILGAYIQGSNDGKTWTTLYRFDTVWTVYATPSQHATGDWLDGGYKTVVPNDTTTAYTYFRYFSDCTNGANILTEFQVFGTPAWSSAEPEYEEIDTSTRDNTKGSLSMTDFGDVVEISYMLADGTVVAYTVPNNAQYLQGPLAGTDDLGRSLYTQEDSVTLYENVSSTYRVGVLTDDHQVGVFYFLLHGEHGDTGKYNITDIIASDPEAAKSINYYRWGGLGVMHYVAEPLYGYYYSSDEWVIRKHMELLTNAGVDFLYFDVSNGYPYVANATKVMKVLHEMNEQGYDAPEVVFYTNTKAGNVAATLYSEIYSKNLYSDTWYMMDGKPMIIVPLGTAVDSMFSIRLAQWPNDTEDNHRDNAWPWIDWDVEQKVYVNADGEAEAISVSVAQHSGVNGEGAWFSESGIYGRILNRGRSWYATYDENGNYVGTRDLTDEDSYLYGYNFQSQFNKAIEKDVPIVLVTGWNEWVAQPLDPAYAAGLGLTGVDTSDRVIFVDNCTLEFSRDLEMTKGYYFDNYYMQLAANVQALKGAVPDVVQDMRKTINLTGAFSQWNDVIVTYTDVEGDNADRGNYGYGQEWLTDTSGRNDIVEAKVTADNTNLYFYVKTKSAITYYDNSSWMELYVNVDGSAETGWYGYDYLITDTIKNENTATAARFTGNGRGTTAAGDVKYRVSGNEMMVEVPLSLLGITDYKEINLEFKWADSDTTIDEMEDFYTEGDAAPLGRMNYVFRNHKASTAIDSSPDASLGNTVNMYTGEIIYSGQTATSVDGSVAGQIISGGVSSAAVANAFDGNLGTQASFTDNSGTDVSYWIGIKTDEPVKPTAFRIATEDTTDVGSATDMNSGEYNAILNTRSNILGSYIQASTDGIHWKTLKVFTDVREYTEPQTSGGWWFFRAPYKIVEVDCDQEYSYFRYFNYDGAGANQLTEFQVFAVDDHAGNWACEYGGDIVYTGVNSTSVDGSLVGEIIGAGVEASVLLELADGRTSVNIDLGDNYDADVSKWMGIKFPRPVTATEIRIIRADSNRNYCAYGLYIQASVDGIHWETIEVLDHWKDWETPANGGTWTAGSYKVITMTLEGEYQYFRFFNYEEIGDNALSEFQVYGTMAEYIPGDIDGNGELDIQDALALFKYSMLPATYPLEYSGDVDFNRDGEINIQDALQLFKHSMLPSVYPLFG